MRALTIRVSDRVATEAGRAARVLFPRRLGGGPQRWLADLLRRELVRLARDPAYQAAYRAKYRADPPAEALEEKDPLHEPPALVLPNRRLSRRGRTG